LVGDDVEDPGQLQRRLILLEERSVRRTVAVMGCSWVGRYHDDHWHFLDVLGPKCSLPVQVATFLVWPWALRNIDGK
jgi:hypothetical protein